MPLTAPTALPEVDSLDQLYPVLSTLRMTAGWHKKRASLWREPRTSYQPAHWRYALGASALTQAGRWIGTELAERRNLLLFNPVDDNDYDTLRTLVAAYQMIKPGEHARAHRHTPNAMRLVLDAAPGCWTIVDGVKLPMRAGDLLLTPGGSWHSHYNEGEQDATWIDILDVPLVHRLEPMLFDEHPQGTQAVDQAPAAHPWYFPPARVQPLLEAEAALDGVRRVVLDTQAAIRPLGIAMLRICAGSSHRAPRSTANRLYAVVSGRGHAHIGGLSCEWSRGDVLAAPTWHAHEFTATEDAQLLEVNDEVSMRLLGFYREQGSATEGKA